MLGVVCLQVFHVFQTFGKQRNFEKDVFAVCRSPGVEAVLCVFVSYVLCVRASCVLSLVPSVLCFMFAQV